MVNWTKLRKQPYQYIEQLGEFGVNINLVIIGGHGSQQRINFGAANDPRLPGYVTKENLSLEPEDEVELTNLYRNPKVAGVLKGSTIILQSCSTGNIRNQRINMVHLIANTIGSSSLVIGPSLPDNTKLVMRYGLYSTRLREYNSHLIVNNIRDRNSI